MGQKKLKRFAEIKTFPNVLEYPEGMQGQWGDFFKNDRPLVLELACGKGEYAVGLGRLYPEKNYLGMDIKGNRLWVGAKTALGEGLSNVGFIRSQIDKIQQYFAPGEVSEVWITFPDPQLRTSKASKRLTHPRFLRLYQRILKEGGFIHLKTDSPELYRFTKTVAKVYGLAILEDEDDVYAKTGLKPELLIRTHYEQLDISRSDRVHYIRFALPAEPLPDLDAALKTIIIEQEADRRGT